jgi:hypothetical protein
MNIHHDTSLRFILEDDFGFLVSRVRVHSCSGKGAMVWLITKPFICLFHIAHFTFILRLRFCLSLIQPLISSFFT